MYSKLIPIIPVSDVALERAFYEKLGFHLYIDPDEAYPEDQFAALAYGDAVLFGVARFDSAKPLTEDGLYWQIETTDMDAVHELALKGALEIIDGPTLQSSSRRTMTLRSPNGYRVGFEEVGP